MANVPANEIDPSALSGLEEDTFDYTEYEKQTWQTGDTITANKLNHIEDGISALQFAHTEDTVFFSGTVVTESVGNGGSGEVVVQAFGVGEFTPDEPITASQLKVTFDGTEYTCSAMISGPVRVYGGIDPGGDPYFTDYPFAIRVSNESVMLATEVAGSHSLVIKTTQTTINSDLQHIIDDATKTLPFMIISGETTIDEFEDAFNAGRIVYFIYEGHYYFVTESDFSYIPDDFALDFEVNKLSGVISIDIQMA